MSERVPAAVAILSSIIIVGYACATAPTTTNPSPTHLSRRSRRPVVRLAVRGCRSPIPRGECATA